MGLRDVASPYLYFWTKNVSCREEGELGPPNTCRSAFKVHILSVLSQDAKFYLQNAKFGNLILTKIIKFVATRCHILRLKCTKCNFRWSSAPNFAGGAYSAPPDPLAGFRGPTIRERKGKGEGREGRKRGWAGMDDPEVLSWLWACNTW